MRLKLNDKEFDIKIRNRPDLAFFFRTLLEYFHPHLRSGVWKEPLVIATIKLFVERVVDEFQCDEPTALDIAGELIQFIVKEIVPKIKFVPQFRIGVLGQKKMRWVTDLAVDEIRRRREGGDAITTEEIHIQTPSTL